MKWRRDDFPAESPARAGFARRGLLRGVAAGAGAVAAVATGARVSAERERQASDDPTKLNYRETEHVRWFYRRARM